MIARDYWGAGQRVVVHSEEGRFRHEKISALPFD